MDLRHTLKIKKTLIFDMDGTIVDNIPYHNRARLLFLEKYGIKFRPNELVNINKLSTKEIIKEYLGINLSPQKIKELDKGKQLIYRNLYKNHIQEVQGLSQFLNEAKNSGKLIALSTMGCRENIALVLNSLGINHYFNVIVSGSEIKKGKPHPEIYNRTLSLLNIKPKEAIVFEDTFNGVESAKQAGISVVGLSTSHTKAEFISWGVLDCIDNFFNCICNVSKN